MIALFAVGVITGTILSFEMGLLSPTSGGRWAGCSAWAWRSRALVLPGGDLIGIYVYGWDRLSPRAHMLSAIPIVLTGFTGSLMVIAVNASMNHPAGFRLVDGKAVDIHPVDALFGNPFCGRARPQYIAATSSPASWSPPPTPTAGCAGAGAATSAPRWRCR